MNIDLTPVEINEVLYCLETSLDNNFTDTPVIKNVIKKLEAIIKDQTNANN